MRIRPSLVAAAIATEPGPEVSTLTPQQLQAWRAAVQPFEAQDHCAL